MNKLLLDTNIFIYDIEIVSVMVESQIPLIGTFNIKDFSHIDEIDIYKVE